MELTIHTACSPDAVEECRGDSNIIIPKTEFEDHLVLLASGIQLNKMTDLSVHLMPLLNKQRREHKLDIIQQCYWYESQYL